MSIFAVAHHVALLAAASEIDRLIAGSALPADAYALARNALAAYFAAALVMPYEPFLSACRETRYDIDRIARRFGASFEQVCHRMTTLQRPAHSGIPLHLIRTDIAGNISKRFSLSGIHIPRHSGACPRWNVYGAFLHPEQINIQISQMPEGQRYFLRRQIDHQGRPSPQCAASLSVDWSGLPYRLRLRHGLFGWRRREQSRARRSDRRRLQDLPAARLRPAGAPALRAPRQPRSGTAKREFVHEDVTSCGSELHRQAGRNKRCRFTWLPAIELLHVSGSFIKEPERRRTEIATLVHLINAQLWLGHFDIWTRDDIVMFRHAPCLAGGAERSDTQCRTIVEAALASCENYFQAFQFVLWAGRSAREAMGIWRPSKPSAPPEGSSLRGRGRW